MNNNSIISLKITVKLREFIPYLELGQQFHTRNGGTLESGKPFQLGLNLN